MPNIFFKQVSVIDIPKVDFLPTKARLSYTYPDIQCHITYSKHLV